MPRLPGHVATRHGEQLYAIVAHAQREVAEAERRRDEAAREALDGGLGVRGVAKALGISTSAAHRRYGGSPRD